MCKSNVEYEQEYGERPEASVLLGKNAQFLKEQIQNKTAHLNHLKLEAEKS